jgi:hypothetical protein
MHCVVLLTFVVSHSRALAGADLRRDGVDFNDVHVADLSDVLRLRRLRWLKLPPLQVPIYCTGREMASVRWGTKVCTQNNSLSYSNRPPAHASLT